MGSRKSANELITHTMYRAKVYRARWVFLQFLAKFQNVIVDGARGWIVLVPPDFVQQFVTADYAVSVLDEELERLELLRSQHDDFAITLDFHLLEVGGDVVETHDLGFWDSRSMAQGGADARQQFPRTERLGDIVIGA